METTSGA